MILALRGLAVLALIVGLLVLALVSFFTPPGQLNLIDRLSGSGDGVTRVAEAVSFGTHGQTLDVWVPDDLAEGETAPVLVFFYGGGWVKGAREDYGFAGRAFASRGYVVVVADYRKVPDILYPAFMDDGAEAVAWTSANIAQYGGNADRLAVAGHSAGAYIAAMLGLDQRWLAGQDLPEDTIDAVVGLSGPYDFFPFTSRRAIDAFSAFPDPQETQPVNYARPDAPPMLLVSSQADTTVRIRNANALSLALTDVGVPHEIKDYGDTGHEGVVMALSVPFRSIAPTLDDSVAFLDRYLR